jgi:hypothetical protein
MRAKLISGAVGAAAVTAVALAPSANACGSLHYVTTQVSWGGSNCIAVQEVWRPEVFCGYGNSWELDERVGHYQDFGMDPTMGAADWISCNVYVDTQLVYSDFAVRGDGTDVNCIRYLT